MTDAKGAQSGGSDASELHVEDIVDVSTDIQPAISKVTLGDDDLLRAQGHESVMKRSFSLLSSLGLAFSITNAWVGALSNFGQNLQYGGSQVALLSILVACCCQWVITLGLSEIASAFPSSGGQYHFVYIVAPEKTKRFAAFVTGWMSILGWWIASCSGTALASTSILGLVHFLHPNFTMYQWHEYVVYLAILMITVIPVVFFPHHIPRLTSWSLYLTLSGFLIWIIAILVMHKHTNSATEIFSPSQGTSGWSSGTAWLLGIINSMYCFTCTDGVIHIAEEMPSPGKRLPQIMNMTMVISLVTAFPLMTVMMVTMEDMQRVLSSKMPAIELLYQATGSTRVTVALAVILTVIYASCLPPQWTTCGRLLWAFARDRGTPYADFFAHVDRSLEFPLRTTITSTIFAALYGLIWLASTTAFNSIITSAITLINLSYAIPQAIILVRGRNKCLPNRPLKLGTCGYLCNLFAPLWSLVMIVFICFPPELPISVDSMNYSAPILVGLFLVILGFWFTSGRHFEGPRIDWELLNIQPLQDHRDRN
ncbi:amino acid/polyamine transporter I [Penicillium malachiteum]|nr:amino acid/polyamine transporter I [Penicillium malachiteum]